MNLRKLGNVQYVDEEAGVGFTPKMGILWTDFSDEPEDAQKMLKGMVEETGVSAEQVEKFIREALENGELVDGEDLTLEVLERLMDKWD